MGCSSSSQTSAVDTIRPGAKPEESNGASTTGAANENGKVAEDAETIPDQGPEEPAVAAASAETTAAAPSEGEEPQTPADSAAAPEAAAPADAAAPSEAEAPAEAAAPAETAAASEEAKPENAEAAAPDPEPKTEEAPAPIE